MNPIVLTQFASPDPNAAPLNLIQLFALANTLVSSTIQGSFVPYIMQSTTPGVDDQDKAWIELDTAGRPLSIKTFYNGHWRRVYNGMIGEIRGFNGDPGYGAPPKNFDITGLGNIGGIYDGWAICNGQNGTPDMSNSFVCGANLNNAGTAGGYDSVKGWETYIAPLTPPVTTAGGGTWLTVLTKEHIPLPVLAQTKMDKYSTSGGGEHSDPSGSLWGVNSVQHVPIPSGTPPDPSYTYPPAGWGSPDSPTGVFTAPPFYSLAWIIFVGYST